MKIFINIYHLGKKKGLIAYTSVAKEIDPKKIDKQRESQIVAFSSLLITFLALKYFLRFIIPDTPESVLILNKRHKVAVDRVVKGF